MIVNVPKNLRRREFMRQVLGAVSCLPMAGFGLSMANAQQTHAPSSAAPGPLSKEDDQFLDELEKATFQYFWEQANPKTGLVKDRCNVRANIAPVLD